jgi:hypothetical protein
VLLVALLPPPQPAATAQAPARATTAIDRPSMRGTITTLGSAGIDATTRDVKSDG